MEVEVVASVSLAMLFSDVIESPSLAAGAFRLCMMMGGGLTLMLALGLIMAQRALLYCSMAININAEDTGLARWCRFV